jgi:hypothetical protein
MPRIPDNSRFGAQLFVSKQMLATTKIEADQLLFQSQRQVADEMARKVFREMTITETEPSYRDQIAIRIECVVLTPEQLRQIIAESRQEGADEAMRWNSANLRPTS